MNKTENAHACACAHTRTIAPSLSREVLGQVIGTVMQPSLPLLPSLPVVHHHPLSFCEMSPSSAVHILPLPCYASQKLNTHCLDFHRTLSPHTTLLSHVPQLRSTLLAPHISSIFSIEPLENINLCLFKC